MNEREKSAAMQLGNVILQSDRLEGLAIQEAKKTRALELAVNELAERLAKTETGDCGPLCHSRIGELEQENIAIRERLAALESRPVVQPYPVHPGWTPPPGYVPMSPWWSPPVYCATKESTQ